MTFFRKEAKKMKSQDIFNKRLKGVMVLLGVPALVMAIGLIYPCASMAKDEKALGIRERQKGFRVSLEPMKPSYGVGEAIRFRIKGNRSFFLYLFSINKEKRRAVILIPSEMQAGNRYRANRSYVVPNPNVEFFSDRPGVEKIVAVATTKYIDLSTEKYSKTGDFLTSTPEEAEAQIKALRIRAREKKKEQFVRELALNIIGSPSRPVVPVPSPTGTASPTHRAIPFISCDREAYRIGDIVRVAFGADRPGWVHIYTVEPDGKSSLLKKQAVSGKEIYHLSARADSPTGRHSLVAVYAKDADFKSKSIPGMGTGAGTKGLALIEPNQPPYAVYRFQILTR